MADNVYELNIEGTINCCLTVVVITQEVLTISLDYSVCIIYNTVYWDVVWIWTGRILVVGKFM